MKEFILFKIKQEGEEKLCISSRISPSKGVMRHIKCVELLNSQQIDMNKIKSRMSYLIII